MLIGIMGSWGSRCLARRKENAWIHVSVLLPSLRQNTLGFDQSSAKPSLPIITRDIVAFTFTHLQDNLSRNSYIQNLAIICCMTEQVRGMDLFLGGRHKLICIVLSLCKHACKSVCDVHPGIDPSPLLARSCNRWWPDFVTFTACKKSRFGLKRGKKAQCASNRCKDLFERKNILGLGAL